MSQQPTPTDEIAALRRELEELEREHIELEHMGASTTSPCPKCEHIRNRLRELGEKV